MKSHALEHVVQSIRNKKSKDTIPFKDMYLFRHVMGEISKMSPKAKFAGILVKDKNGDSIVMVNLLDGHGDTETGKIFEFKIMDTVAYDKFRDHDDSKCTDIMTGFDSEKYDLKLSFADKTIVPAGVMLYGVYDNERVARNDHPANAKIEILYTNRNLRGQGVATRLKNHFNEILKHKGIQSYFGYSSALDLIDGKDKHNSNEVLKRIYGRMGIHIVPKDPHGLFFGYPNEFESIDLPTKYLSPVSKKNMKYEKEKAHPVAVVEELAR